MTMTETTTTQSNGDQANGSGPDVPVPPEWKLASLPSADNGLDPTLDGDLGPVIDKLAAKGNPEAVAFPRAMWSRQSLEFSFSGLKAAVARLMDAEPDTDKATVAASFVAAAIDVLAAKCARALQIKPATSLVVVGGVAASPQVREKMAEVAAEAAGGLDEA